MKNFFKDDNGNLSMGRLLAFALFFICCGVWIFIKATGKEISANDTALIQWGWGVSIIGKGVQKFAENIKKSPGVVYGGSKK